jgi:hypothetical protein
MEFGRGHAIPARCLAFIAQFCAAPENVNRHIGTSMGGDLRLGRRVANRLSARRSISEPDRLSRAQRRIARPESHKGELGREKVNVYPTWHVASRSRAVAQSAARYTDLTSICRLKGCVWRRRLRVLAGDTLQSKCVCGTPFPRVSSSNGG